MYTYILCEFIEGIFGQFYQEVGEYGVLNRMTDLDGNTIEPSGSYSAKVIDPNPPRPTWA